MFRGYTYETDGGRGGGRGRKGVLWCGVAQAGRPYPLKTTIRITPYT